MLVSELLYHNINIFQLIIQSILNIGFIQWFGFAIASEFQAGLCSLALSPNPPLFRFP